MKRNRRDMCDIKLLVTDPDGRKVWRTFRGKSLVGTETLPRAELLGLSLHYAANRPCRWCIGRVSLELPSLLAVAHMISTTYTSIGRVSLHGFRRTLGEGRH